MQNAWIMDLLNQYGFATIAVVGMGCFIYFIYKYVTTEIKVRLGEMNVVLIALIDRVRMLDNDMIRLNTKLAMVLEYKEDIIKEGRSDELDEILKKYKSKSKTFDSTGDVKK